MTDIEMKKAETETESTKPYCMATIDFTYEYEDEDEDELICVPHFKTFHNHLSRGANSRFESRVIAGQIRTITFLHGSELCTKGPTEINFPLAPYSISARLSRLYSEGEAARAWGDLGDAY